MGGNARRGVDFVRETPDVERRYSCWKSKLQSEKRRGREGENGGDDDDKSNATTSSCYSTSHSVTLHTFKACCEPTSCEVCLHLLTNEHQAELIEMGMRESMILVLLPPPLLCVYGGGHGNDS